MPFDPISWAITGFVVGALTVGFWEEIVEWADRTFARILNTIDKVIYVVSDRVVYLVTGKSGVYEKRMEVYSQSVNTGQFNRNVVSEPVPASEVPYDIRQQVNEQRKVRILQNKSK
jgi:hypothetical protein